jgi:YgiT-type zinc finger domain-containing protein
VRILRRNGQPRTVEQEVFKHKDGFIILEDVTIGICDTCGNRYYSADVLHAVHQLASGMKKPEKFAEVPVGHVA